MFKKILVVISAVVFFSGLTECAFAVMCGSHSKHEQTAQAQSNEFTHTQADVITQTTLEESVNVGNKICPVSGEKIDEKMKVTYEYQGKIYNFCCAMCIDEFKKDPEKYIKKVEEELNSESKEELTEEKPTSSEEHGMHEEHHH